MFTPCSQHEPEDGKHTHYRIEIAITGEVVSEKDNEQESNDIIEMTSIVTFETLEMAQKFVKELSVFGEGLLK